MNPYTIEVTSANVLTIRFTDIAAGWEQWIMLRSDAHHDSPRCNRDLERKQLDRALERKALIFDCGDLFDAMQGKFDPRRNLEDVRPEDAKADYYDQIVRHAAEDYEPYAAQWLLFGKGNHEMAVLNNTNHDIATSLVDKMRAAGSPGVPGGFGGWLRFQFFINKTKRTTKVVHYFHGAGGDAPVTRGTIKTNRQQVYLPDADVVWNGHDHNSLALPIARVRLNDSGKVSKDLCWHVHTPGYKDDYGDGSGGWAVERGSPPKPMGCGWLKLYLSDPRKGRIDIQAEQDVE